MNLDYSTHLWEEKEIKRVANVSRRDVTEFLAAAEIPIKPAIERYALKDANQVLIDLKYNKVRGGKVLIV
jgi:propanol-preferring alcohol dehydrogenase